MFFSTIAHDWIHVAQIHQVHFATAKDALHLLLECFQALNDDEGPFTEVVEQVNIAATSRPPFCNSAEFSELLDAEFLGQLGIIFGEEFDDGFGGHV